MNKCIVIMRLAGQARQITASSSKRRCCLSRPPRSGEDGLQRDSSIAMCLSFEYVASAAFMVHILQHSPRRWKRVPIASGPGTYFRCGLCQPRDSHCGAWQTPIQITSSGRAHPPMPMPHRTSDQIDSSIGCDVVSSGHPMWHLPLPSLPSAHRRGRGAERGNHARVAWPLGRVSASACTHAKTQKVRTGEGLPAVVPPFSAPDSVQSVAAFGNSEDNGSGHEAEVPRLRRLALR